MTDQNQPPEGEQQSWDADVPPNADAVQDTGWSPVPEPGDASSGNSADAYTQPSADPQGQPSAPQYGQSTDPYAPQASGQPGADPYAQPSAPQFGQSADPYAQPGAGAYGQPGIQPGQFGNPAAYGGQMNPQYNAGPNEQAANTLTLNYWLSVFFSWIPALIFFLIEKDKNALVDDHLKENMNFQITRVIAGLITMVPVIGWVVGGIASLVLFVFAIIGALKAPDEYRAGRAYRYPFSIRVLK